MFSQLEAGGGTVIRVLVDFALNNKFVVLAVAILLLGWGASSRFTICRWRPIPISRITM
jgi:hypothetical protein